MVLYPIQVVIYSAAMLLIYAWLLRDKAYHALSRYFLLLNAVLPILLPLVQLPQSFRTRIPISASLGYALQEVGVRANSAASNSVTAKGLPLPVVIYGLITLLILAVYSAGLFRIFLTVAKCTKQTKGAITLVYNTGFGPGSFGRYIFLPESTIDAAVLAHEEAHIHFQHTVDLVLLSLLQAICWPNFFLYLLKKELKEVHEFQADEAVSADAETYSALILSATFNAKTTALTHSFINHPIKRRIMMLRKNGTGTPRRALIQVVVAVSLLGWAAVTLQSCGKNSGQAQATVENQTSAAHEKMKMDSLATLVVDKTEEHRKAVTVAFPEHMPYYRGDMGSFLRDHVRYPEYAREHKIEGRVLVKFIVTKTGKITLPEIVKSPDTSLSRAALEAIATMPDWMPGENKGLQVDVPFYQPITFQL